jgi:hypothetical protein
MAMEMSFLGVWELLGLEIELDFAPFALECEIANE